MHETNIRPVDFDPVILDRGDTQVAGRKLAGWHR